GVVMDVFKIIAIILALATTAAVGHAQVRADFEADDASWNFGKGSEYPGAQGSFERSTDTAHAGAAAARLAGDFSGGGRYVHLSRAFKPAVAAGDVSF